jgi:lipopolysaccharide transport system ATP-binding protein
MGDTVIRVENLCKSYQISHQEQKSYGTLRDTIASGIKSISQGFTNNKQGASNSRKEEFWALKDIFFEINQGDRVGIIGRNGAGKSTLLKILSRITEPTKGSISIKGRVASLLEVGTGFHGELTGRENIYLNGAILGMEKLEIKRKFDEIVDFAEVEKFLDTPVKRYSSGMYVRLAFAVAAYLEPEILIVDEVLAVGDASFQKKCLGKMQSVSREEGRTVLFVSHNMDAIQRLCSQCIFLEKGLLAAQGETNKVAVRYLSNNASQASDNEWLDVSRCSRIGTGEAKFVKIQYSGLNEAAAFKPYSLGSIEFTLEISSNSQRSIGSLAITICDKLGNKLVNTDSVEIGQSINLKQGSNFYKIRIDKIYLKPGIYTINLWLADPLVGEPLDFLESAFELEIVNLRKESLGIRPQGDGIVTCDFEIFSMS